MKRWIYAVPAVGFLALAVVLFQGLFSGRAPDLLPSALINKPAPDIGLEAMDDVTPGFTRADLAAGHVTVVNFFASWCVPCRMESAQLMAVFGLGTLPAMAAVTLGGEQLRTHFQRPMVRQGAGIFLVLIGIVTIAVPWQHAGHGNTHQPHHNTLH